MEIILYVDKIIILIKQLESLTPEDRIINFTSCIVLLECIQKVQPNNANIKAFTVQILSRLERICGLTYNGYFVDADITAALNSLDDLKKDFFSYNSHF